MPAFAVGGCPQSADRLADFRRCLAPMQGKLGMRYVGTQYELDEDHTELLAAMHRTNVVPPQVMPGAVGITNPMYPFYPYYPITGAAFYLGVGSGMYPAYSSYSNFHIVITP